MVHFEGWRQDATPGRISDHEGLHWVVAQIVGHWVHPNLGKSGADKVGYGVEAERWRLVVDGPLPYASGRGMQPVAIRTYNDGAGWYLLVDHDGGVGRPEDVLETS